MFLDEQCIASTWFGRTVRVTKQVIQVLRRIASRTRGVKENELRHFVRAFVHSRIIYGAPFHPITRTQLSLLERLNNEARRVITGLLKYTPLPALKSCSALSDIADLMSTHKLTHIARLKSAKAGRLTLEKVGFDISTLPPLPEISPPWEHIDIVDSKPLPPEHGTRTNGKETSFRKTITTPKTRQLIDGNDLTRKNACHLCRCSNR
ncbi:hypothetical protein HPB48_005430 [Haemaphysalis longicornis]|uniref:Tick transposon n=1 Tax=Haemaphysalis longicornis TaxID=44386 RepID=A0A9J6GHA9_HAELO|nr:hypothetical protein HPB48_005430 [Haemaphysalis longicornis]